MLFEHECDGEGAVRCGRRDRQEPSPVKLCEQDEKTRFIIHALEKQGFERYACVSPRYERRFILMPLGLPANV